MKNKSFYIILFVILALGLVKFVRLPKNEPVSDNKPTQISNSPQMTNKSDSIFKAPIAQAQERVTKKPFGIYVSPSDSPVQPERFTGYHTGVDFETFPSEADIDVPIYVICSGPLLEKITASGYGGVAVQKCEFENQSITVIYGHIKLTSVTTVVGKVLTKGEKLAILGKGYSAETGGERKHLHLGIHKDASINILGYVQNKSELSNWINFADYWH